MKNKLPNIVLSIILYIGLSLLLYPTVADWWNSRLQGQVIADYMDAVDALTTDEYDEALEKAREYNAGLLNKANYWALTDEEREVYNSLLNIVGNGVMGYITIPAIGVSLPIGHGTDIGVLTTSIGHLEYTSLPVGGSSTHTALSGHRGLPSAKLFSDLDMLVEGDRFQLHILNETFTYEVDQILTVLPEETDALQIEPGRDYCTLVTCTPYGVNTHRLLVRAHQVEDKTDWSRLPAEAVKVSDITVAIVISLPLLIIWAILVVVRYRKLGKGRRKEHMRHEGK